MASRREVRAFPVAADVWRPARERGCLFWIFCHNAVGLLQVVDQKFSHPETTERKKELHQNIMHSWNFLQKSTNWGNLWSRQSHLKILFLLKSLRNLQVLFWMRQTLEKPPTTESFRFFLSLWFFKSLECEAVVPSFQKQKLWGSRRLGVWGIKAEQLAHVRTGNWSHAASQHSSVQLSQEFKVHLSVRNLSIYLNFYWKIIFADDQTQPFSSPHVFLPSVVT